MNGTEPKERDIVFPLPRSRFKPYHHLPVANTLVRRRVLRDPDVDAQVRRVAVGCALICEPSMYPLDEPPSNSDAILRSQMRAEIGALHQRVGKSFVHVTHDQVEAMTMGTRIIVLNEGVIQQYETPKEIDDSPANTFVARFIGSPPMNLIRCRLDGRSLRFPDGVRLQLPEGGASPNAPDREVLLGVRAEKISVAPSDAVPSDAVASDTMPAHIVASEYLGAETVVAFKPGRRAHQTEQDTVAEHDLLQAGIPGELHLTPCADFTVRLDLTNASFFDVDSGERLPVAVPGATR